MSADVEKLEFQIDSVFKTYKSNPRKGFMRCYVYNKDSKKKLIPCKGSLKNIMDQWDPKNMQQVDNKLTSIKSFPVVTEPSDPTHTLTTGVHQFHSFRYITTPFTKPAVLYQTTTRYYRQNIGDGDGDGDEDSSEADRSTIEDRDIVECIVGLN